MCNVILFKKTFKKIITPRSFYIKILSPARIERNFIFMNFPFPLHSPFLTLLVLFPLIPFPALFAHASSLPGYPLPCFFLYPHQFELYFTLLPWQASFYSLYPSLQSAFFSLSSSCILLRYNYHFVFLLSHPIITSLTFFILTFHSNIPPTVFPYLDASLILSISLITMFPSSPCRVQPNSSFCLSQSIFSSFFPRSQ